MTRDRSVQVLHDINRDRDEGAQPIGKLLEASDEGVGYLLKDRVADMTEFANALRRIADGEVVLDEEIDAIAGSAPN